MVRVLRLEHLLGENKRFISSLLAGAALLMSTVIVNAHHSYAMFDTSQTMVVRGTLKTLEWTNPHVWVWVDVEDEKTKSISTYGFETLSPAQLMRDYGWDKAKFKAGQTMTVVYAPLKSGNRGGALIKLTLSDGQAFETRFSVPREGAPSSVTNK